MDDGRYTRVKSRFWGDEKVAQWDNETKFLALYLLTSPHGNILGCYVLHKLYICADLNWTPEQLERPFNNLINAGFIKYDERTNLILITNYLHHNPITNPNQVKACIKQLKELPRSVILNDLLVIVEALHKALLKDLGKDYLKDLVEALGYTVTVSVTVTETVSVDKNICAPDGADCAPAAEPGTDDAENADDAYPPEFEEFWLQYPRKREKRKAFKAWRARLKGNKNAVADMIAAARHYATYCLEREIEQQYIKLPATFIGPDRPYLEWKTGPPENLGPNLGPPFKPKGGKENGSRLQHTAGSEETSGSAASEYDFVWQN